MQSTSGTIRERPVELTTADRRVIGWWIVNAVVFLHVVLFETPLWLTYAYNGMLYAVGAGLSYYHAAIRQVLVVGTVAGFVELGADYFLVEVAGVLVYPGGLPMLLESPLYMPLAWAIATTQLGYLAIRLRETYGPRAAVAGPSVVAMALLGFYESGASLAGIWEYVDAPFLVVGHAPVFVVVAEGMMFATLYFFVRRDRPVVGGVGFGLSITASYVVAYYLFVALGSL